MALNQLEQEANLGKGGWGSSQHLHAQVATASLAAMPSQGATQLLLTEQDWPSFRVSSACLGPLDCGLVITDELLELCWLWSLRET